MLKILSKIIAFFLAVLLILIGILAVGQLIPNQYINSYNASIIEKYKYLNKRDEPAIILVGGSNVAFGIDSEKISKEMGMKVINMGLHAGLKRDFELNLVKSNIIKGDKIILMFEYSAYAEDPMNQSISWYTIDGQYKFMKMVPYNQMFHLLRYYPIYLALKTKDALINPFPDPDNDVYIRHNFNEYGDLIVDSDVNINKPTDITTRVQINGNTISDESVESLNSFNEFCKSRGAEVYASSPALDKITVTSSDDEIAAFESYYKKHIDIPMISNTKDYTLDTSYFYDTHYHLNKVGVEKRTGLLIDDLKAALNRS